MFVIINIFLLNRFYSDMPKLMPIDAIRLHCVRWPRRYALQMFDIAESWDHCYPLSVYKTKWDQDYKNFEKKWVREETIQQFATVVQNYYKIDQPCAIHRGLVTELKTYSANGEDPCDINLFYSFRKRQFLLNSWYVAVFLPSSLFSFQCQGPVLISPLPLKSNHPKLRFVEHVLHSSLLCPEGNSWENSFTYFKLNTLSSTYCKTFPPLQVIFGLDRWRCLTTGSSHHYPLQAMSPVHIMYFLEQFSLECPR